MERRPENPLRQRSLWIALALWVAGSLIVFPLSKGHLPFARPSMAHATVAAQVLLPQAAVVVFLLLMALVYGLTWRREIPDMRARSPERAVARRELWLLWIYIAVVMAAGQFLGRRFFGEGIAMHLNGSLFGATRMQSPTEVWTWSIYNFIFFALIPYLVFRARGYSREALNLKSVNLKNDTLVIVVVLAIMITLDYLRGGGIFTLPPRQAVLGGALTFVVDLLGTCLPVMILIYAIMMPRYARLTGSKTTLWLLGAVSYPTLHLLEYWTDYGSVTNALLSVVFVYLTFFPAGMVKSFLTMRTGNAWVHVWAFHAISPHVMVDTPLLVHDFGIRG